MPSLSFAKYLSLSRRVKHRRGKPGTRSFPKSKPGKGEYSDVVILTKCDRSFGGFCEQGGGKQGKSTTLSL